MNNNLPNVLLLGVSYPSLQRTLEGNNKSFVVDECDGRVQSSNHEEIVAKPVESKSHESDVSFCPLWRKVAEMGGIVDLTSRSRGNTKLPTPAPLTLNNCINTVLNCVKSSYMTAMDGRDLARCLATEQHCSVRVYTVSQEDGAVYEPSRHLWANFNRASFVNALLKKFGNIQFDQVILDYFWIPPGWDVAHWKSHFFQHTLVQLARQNVLQQPKIDECNEGTQPKQLNTFKTGVVYLPFCFHCFKEVMAHIGTLTMYYDVSFLRKGSLGDITLWSGTQQIDANSMQGVLGKRRDQEEVYCSFGPCDVREALDDSRISKARLIGIARQLEDFSLIRFIVLTRLTENQTTGQIRGLLPPSEVQRGFDQISTIKIIISAGRKLTAVTSTTSNVATPSKSSSTTRTPVISKERRKRLRVVSASPPEPSSPAFNTRLCYQKRKAGDFVDGAQPTSQPKCRKRLFGSRGKSRA
ncbi:hypothetical protein ACA910_004956 [Epithemia clementina (nom. ined.)]